jgi:hypothetical protein
LIFLGEYESYADFCSRNKCLKGIGGCFILTDYNPKMKDRRGVPEKCGRKIPASGKGFNLEW